jgi:RNA polymerase sigma factor (sigma-70 family)
MKLTTEQQQIIQDSVWVVNTALKKQGLSTDEDMRQSAILYMCKCLLRFDPSKNVKWTTYAYNNVYLYIMRVHKKEVQKKSRLVGEDLFAILHKDEDFNEEVVVLDQILGLCTPEEREVLELKRQGYKGAEIGQILGYTHSKVNSYLHEIREKAKRTISGVEPDFY